MTCGKACKNNKNLTLLNFENDNIFHIILTRSIKGTRSTVVNLALPSLYGGSFEIKLTFHLKKPNLIFSIDIFMF